MIETVPSGTVLNGHYRIERVLGSGGFGHVYLALDLSTNQQYALKEYLVSGPGGQEQLMHEANVLSQLHHPNLPAFHDAFNERGHYYVILNYIEGEDLTDIIRMTQRRNEVIPITQVMGWILATCDAVLFLHNQRPPVIHRDIKPDNIRIVPNGTAILVDLGNAKAYADGLRTLLFIRHQGTPGYAPPEQYPGGSGTDARSDVYALGATLYFAITAHEPPSVSVRNQALQQGQPDLPTLQDILAQNPPENSPEAEAAKQFRLGVSKPAKPAPRHSRHLAQLGTLSPMVLNQLNTILQRSMAMRPKDRYQFVADFANDLKRAVASITAEMQQVKPPPNPYSTQPDLPMLYEAMQNAKAAEKQGAQNVAQAPTPRLTSPSYCPQCHATLMPNAAFCPNCGTSLPSAANSGGGVRMPDSSPSLGKGLTQGRAGAVDQAITAIPQNQQTPRASIPMSTPPPPAFTGNTAPSGNPSSWNTTPIVPPDPSRSNTSSGQSMQQKAPTSGFTIGPGLVIAVLIVLIILISIMIVLLIINHAHHAIGQFPHVVLHMCSIGSIL
ncbi:MAG: hypothetical protein NVS4B11_31450 [Ktedonobacteraceae bacterium]